MMMMMMMMMMMTSRVVCTDGEVHMKVGEIRLLSILHSSFYSILFHHTSTRWHTELETLV
jgi:hypothetical protein